MAPRRKPALEPESDTALDRAGSQRAFADKMKVPEFTVARWKKTGVESGDWDDLKRHYGVSPPAPTEPAEPTALAALAGSTSAAPTAPASS